jgi:hypothetical protein
MTYSHELGGAYLIAGGFIQRALDMALLVQVKGGAEIILRIKLSAVGCLPWQVRRLDPFAVAVNGKPVAGRELAFALRLRPLNL